MQLTIIRWRPGQLARHGVVLLSWMLVRAMAQVGIVVLLARELGAKSYGELVAVIAVASFFTPFVGLGLSNMVLRNGSRDAARLPVYLARAIRWWARSWPPCVIAAIIAAALLLPSGLPIAATSAVIAAELGASSLTDLRARHRQAQQRINDLGAINAGLPIVRLATFAAVFLVIRDAAITTVLWTYAASSMLYATFLWLPIPANTASLDQPASEPMTSTSGLPFSLAAFATKLQAEFNKPVLAHAGFGLAGTYNVAQRAMDMATLPLLALQESLWPRLYAQSNPTRQLWRSGLMLLALALALGLALWFAAPLLPRILGDSFAEAVSTLRLLALLPLLQTFRYLVNFHVIHRAWMALIGWAYGVGAVTSIALVAVLVPRWGMSGAAIAAYLTEAAMTMTLLTGAFRKRQK